MIDFCCLQVRIISNIEAYENVPSFDEIFRDDVSVTFIHVLNIIKAVIIFQDDDDDVDEEGNQRFDEESLEKKRQKRLWEQRRQDLLYEYSQFTYYGNSVRKFTNILFLKLYKT